MAGRGVHAHASGLDRLTWPASTAARTASGGRAGASTRAVRSGRATSTAKIDAERFLTAVEHRLLSGSYVPPAAGRMRIEDYAAEWTARRRSGWRDATAQRYERELRLHILPKLGDWPLAAVRREHVERWAGELRLKPSSVAAVAQTLSALFASAVEDGRLASNPVSGARLPQVDRPPLVPLTGDQVRAFAAGAPEHIRAAVLVAAGTGLRQGELFGLTVDRIDFLRRELRVDQQLWTPRKGPAVLAPPKTQNSYRTIAVSSVVADGLSAHLATFGARPDGLVFHTPPGGMVVRAHGLELRTAGGAGLGPREARGRSRAGRGSATSVRAGTTCATTMRACFCRRASARLSWPSAWATTSRRCCARTRT